MTTSSPLIQAPPPSLHTAEEKQFLRFENVSKVYPTPKGPYPVLEGVELSVSEGEFTCVIGHSGCGKSTLLNMVSGFATPPKAG
jgi:ABC-type nitrate/sulfonate/bicarbonate transport system ATPase subunit